MNVYRHVEVVHFDNPNDDRNFRFKRKSSRAQAILVKYIDHDTFLAPGGFERLNSAISTFTGAFSQTDSV